MLAGASVAYNVIEAIIAISAGLAAGSVALIGFGLDSMTGDLAQIFFDTFAISPEDQLRAKNITWPSLTYSVIVDLDFEE